MNMSHTDESQEFWLFIEDSPLPDISSIAQAMSLLDSCFRLNGSGKPEKAEDGIFFGDYIDETGESQLDVFWVMEVDDAQKVFRKDPKALKQIGNRKKLLRFILEDECALGHVFAMILSILNDRNGLLVIPDEQGLIVLEHLEAKNFLAQEIKDNDPL